MEKTVLASCLVLFVLWANAHPARAGLCPLEVRGEQARPAPQAKLRLLADKLVHRILSDHVVAEQILRISAETSGAFYLGLPAHKKRDRGPQDLELRVGKQSVKVRRLNSQDERAAVWLTAKIELKKGQTTELKASWWQAHEEAQLYGYWRYALIDPLWTSAGFLGPPGQLQRLVRLSPGNDYSSSQPETEEAPADVPGEVRRRYERTDSAPEADSSLTIFYKRKIGAFSACQGGQVWAALDGDSETLFKPEHCPKGQVWIDLLADCDGFGTAEPACTRAAGPRLDIGLSIRTRKDQARFPVEVEGWFGPKRVWRKKGRSNQSIRVNKTAPVTKYRILLPKGIPSEGLGEIWLARVDLANSSEGALRTFSHQGWIKAKSSCSFVIEFQNPVDIRHVTLQLKPKVQPRKEWAIYTACSNLNSTYPFHEPFPHEHSIEKLRAAGLDTSWIEGVDQHEHGPDCDCHKAKHFKRKHPDRIELEVHPVCIETQLRIYSPRSPCNIPRLHLVF